MRRRDLEKGKTHEKVNAMKKTILMMINGEMMDGFLMIIIRFVLPDEDRELKKLSLLYLEIVDKTDAAGKMLPEFILVWCARTPARRPAHHPGTAQHTGRCVHTSGVAARKLQGTMPDPPVARELRARLWRWARAGLTAHAVRDSDSDSVPQQPDSERSEPPERVHPRLHAAFRDEDEGCRAH